MQNMRKAPDEAKASVKNYEELTARKNVIEQILIDRMGVLASIIDMPFFLLKFLWF